MNVTLNGQPHETEGESLSVTAFLKANGLDHAPMLVELNGEAVLVREFDDTRISHGDTVEVIRMVAGG